MAVRGSQDVVVYEKSAKGELDLGPVLFVAQT
jgi:hypothetical protein